MSNEDQQFLQDTETLKRYVLKINQIYEEVRSTGQEKDFYVEVKPFVDEVHAFLISWEKKAKKFIDINHPRNLYFQQIDATIENIKEISVQAFFPKTSYSRFKHRFHSIHYILEKMLDEIKKCRTS